MSTQSNKQVVQRYFDAVNAGDEKAVYSLLTDDFQFKSMPRNPEWLKYRWNREQFAATPRLMSQTMNKPIVLKLLGMTAEDNRVCAEATSHGELKNGVVYENDYHFIFEIRDGKVAEVREYSCSYTAADVFGNFEKNFKGVTAPQ
jgi:uncharacterized protein